MRIRQKKKNITEESSENSSQNDSSTLTRVRKKPSSSLRPSRDTVRSRKKKLEESKAKTNGSNQTELQSVAKWPFPENVGAKIPPEFREYHIPQDDYYYVGFPIANVLADTKDNFKVLSQLEVPFEYAKSVSGSSCICYRVHRKYEKHPDIYRGADDWHTCPVVMPGMQYGRKTEYRMRQQPTLPYLYKEWNPVPKVRIRKRKTEVSRVRRKKA